MSKSSAGSEGGIDGRGELCGFPFGISGFGCGREGVEQNGVDAEGVQVVEALGDAAQGAGGCSPVWPLSAPWKARVSIS